MSASVLGPRLVASAFFLSSIVAACGGKVVFESGSGPGQGGAGGTGGVTTTTSTSPTTTTSPTTSSSSSSTSSSGIPSMCTCGSFCQTIMQCGGPGGPPGKCENACNNGQIPQNIVQCVCNTGGDCGALQGCLGGPGSSSSSSSGGSMACSDCANNAAMSLCSPQLQACQNNQACVDIFSCHNNCGFSPQCAQKCEGQNPAGAGPFLSLMSCMVCTSCIQPCLNTPLTQYCTLGGP